MAPSKSLKSVTLITTTAAATLLLIQACGGGAWAEAGGDADPVEGVWESVVTVKDCSSGAVLASFRGVAVHHRGGTLSADNSRPPASRGAAFGTWKRTAGGAGNAYTGGNAYTANVIFMRFNPDSSLAGIQKVQRSFTLGADGNSLAGTNVVQIIDAAGVVLQQGCATETGVRTTW